MTGGNSPDGSEIPITSVLVTVYNRELYLEATLTSILKSSFNGFELIIVDDCSTDRSPDIAKQFAKVDSRIRFVQNEENLGDYGNRMKAASLARGKYLKYVDSDDLIYPYSLQVMIDAMEQHPDAAVGLAHSMPEDDEPYPWKLTPADTYRKHFLGRGCLSCGPTGAIIRREAFKAFGGFRKDWGVLSDTEFWLRMAASRPVILLPPGLVWWRRHEGQEFTKDDAVMVYINRGHELDMETLQSPNCPLSPADRDSALSRSKQVHARRILSTGLRQMRPLAAARLFRKSQLRLSDLLRGFGRYA